MKMKINVAKRGFSVFGFFILSRLLSRELQESSSVDLRND